MKAAYSDLLPELTADEFEALKADIAKRGVQVPIEIDAKRNEILDGNHRYKACLALGIKQIPSVKRTFRSEAERKEHALKLNILRRHINPLIWAEAFDQLLKVRGIKRGQGARNDNGTSATVAQVAEELGASRRTAFRRLRIKNALAAHPELTAKVRRGELRLPAAIGEARRKEQRKKQQERLAERRSLEEKRRATFGDNFSAEALRDLEEAKSRKEEAWRALEEAKREADRVREETVKPFYETWERASEHAHELASALGTHELVRESDEPCPALTYDECKAAFHDQHYNWWRAAGHPAPIGDVVFRRYVQHWRAGDDMALEGPGWKLAPESPGEDYHRWVVSVDSPGQPRWPRYFWLRGVSSWEQNQEKEIKSKVEMGTD
jgi:ParB-like chromosome segregation protein Spo0J